MTGASGRHDGLNWSISLYMSLSTLLASLHTGSLLGGGSCSTDNRIASPLAMGYFGLDLKISSRFKQSHHAHTMGQPLCEVKQWAFAKRYASLARSDRRANRDLLKERTTFLAFLR
jgi:hypothetical protein